MDLNKSFLNKFKYGELAVQELSRDMLKDFIINQIGMISLSWEQVREELIYLLIYLLIY